MKRWLPLVLGLTALSACTRPAPQQGLAADAAAATSTQTPAAVAQEPGTTTTEVTSQIIYVDVRTPQEFAAGHVKGALNIPYDQMARRWTELQKYQDRPMILYCRTGHRAGIALQELKKHGFARAINGGGLQGLQEKGVPVVTN